MARPRSSFFRARTALNATYTTWKSATRFWMARLRHARPRSAPLARDRRTGKLFSSYVKSSSNRALQFVFAKQTRSPSRLSRRGRAVFPDVMLADIHSNPAMTNIAKCSEQSVGQIHAATESAAAKNDPQMGGRVELSRTRKTIFTTSRSEGRQHHREIHVFSNLL